MEVIHRDKMETCEGALIQHGPLSNRIYLMKLGDADPAAVAECLIQKAKDNGYTKIFAKVPRRAVQALVDHGFSEEAAVPGFYHGEEDAVFLGLYLDPRRATAANAEEIEGNIKLALEKQKSARPLEGDCPLPMRVCVEDDAEAMSVVYKQVFPTYPFPIDQPAYLIETMRSHVAYFCCELDGKMIAIASAEMDEKGSNAEMTDFATLPESRGRGLAAHLLLRMEGEMRKRAIKTAYTIARAVSPGMNIVFAKAGYAFGGTLINNTNISGQIESMNVWYKQLED